MILRTLFDTNLGGVVMPDFVLKSEYKPKGDQPEAIKQLVDGINNNMKHQVLLGATGTGKTFTMACVIEQVKKPTLVIAHNKTLAQQLCGEFREFFPDNAVNYFVSYYDYYQPEAYVPQTDTYIEKDASINEEIDRLRHAATSALFERRDVIIVASVSCIYGLGSPEDYQGMTISLKNGEVKDRDKIIRRLVGIRYVRNDIGFERNTFRVRGDIIEVIPAYQDNPIRIELFGDEIDRIVEVDLLTGEILKEMDELTIYPATHYITTEEKMKQAIVQIKTDLEVRLKELRAENKLLEAQRLEQRTRYDLEMMEEMGFCQGIENYSRYLTGREPGEAPSCLLDYFPDDFLLFIDESHVTIPQIRAMYGGDHSRKINHYAATIRVGPINYGQFRQGRPLQQFKYSQKSIIQPRWRARKSIYSCLRNFYFIPLFPQIMKTLRKGQGMIGDVQGKPVLCLPEFQFDAIKFGKFSNHQRRRTWSQPEYIHFCRNFETIRMIKYAQILNRRPEVEFLLHFNRVSRLRV